MKRPNRIERVNDERIRDFSADREAAGKGIDSR